MKFGQRKEEGIFEDIILSIIVLINLIVELCSKSEIICNKLLKFEIR